ncbi:MAG: hypothetical protein KDD33_03500 [Bdellovibrionales bacterium]|nr:hypothetical protein [Bdellovibrionales bacterium]
MSIFKKTLSLLLITAASLSLSACWEKDSDSAASHSEESMEQAADQMHENGEEAHQGGEEHTEEHSDMPE